MADQRISQLPTASGVELTDNTELVFNTPLGVTKRATWGQLKTFALSGNKVNQIVVNQANASITLGGVIDSTKEYFIDGIINMTGIQIDVPVGGVHIHGYDFDISQLVCADNNYSMFTDAAGTGDVLIQGVAIEVTGTNSEVFSLTDVDGTHAIEFTGVNFIDCTSLGTLTDYRQGLEFNTGRFGGRPSLTFVGAWAGGYRVSSSIVRGIDDLMPNALFAQGVGFVMQSRFLTDLNVDLGTTAPFIDFVSANFPNPSTLQFHSCEVSRKGLFDPNDTTIIATISAGDLASDWRDNNGIENTFVGGEAIRTVEIATPVAVAGTFYELLGTMVASDLQHFDSPANGRLRHLGITPRSYNVFGEFILDCTATNEIDLRLAIWRSAGAVFEYAKVIRRVVNNLQGGRDVAFFTYVDNIDLNQNDYVQWEVANVGATNNITDELDSYYIIEKR